MRKRECSQGQPKAPGFSNDTNSEKRADDGDVRGSEGRKGSDRGVTSALSQRFIPPLRTYVCTGLAAAKERPSRRDNGVLYRIFSSVYTRSAATS